MRAFCVSKSVYRCDGALRARARSCERLGKYHDVMLAANNKLAMTRLCYDAPMQPTMQGQCDDARAESYLGEVSRFCLTACSREQHGFVLVQASLYHHQHCVPCSMVAPEMRSGATLTPSFLDAAAGALTAQPAGEVQERRGVLSKDMMDFLT